MKRGVILLLVLIVLAGCNQIKFIQAPPEEREPLSINTTCLVEQRNILCPNTTQPVCGYFNESFKCKNPPCFQEFSNPCLACTEEVISYYADTNCPQEESMKKKILKKIQENGGSYSLEIDLKQECLDQDGQWLNKTQTCDNPTSDAGKPCDDKEQCESYCEAPRNSLNGAQVIGTCYRYHYADCMQELRGGTAKKRWCVS